jgi:hypothetical protein
METKVSEPFKSQICINLTRVVGFNSWRLLGDVISSLIYLGYHQEIKSEPDVPCFLTELRRTAFAHIYSDDKNVAVFLGRPPRLSRRFCCFQIPQKRPTHDDEHYEPVVGSIPFDQVLFRPHETINSCTGIRWTALCACLKEEALELIQARQTSGHGDQNVSYDEISTMAADGS